MVVGLLLCSPAFAEHKVEVTDKIALPGKMSGSTPYNHYTRLILDSSGENVYGVSNNDNLPSWNNRRATHWSGDNYQDRRDLGGFKEDDSGSSQITSIAQDGKILGGFGDIVTNINDRVHAGIWSGKDFATKTTIPTDDTARSTSYIYALSGDGRVIAGSRSGWSGLAILKNDGSDWTKAVELPKLPHSTANWFSTDDSRVLALNNDGSVAVGGSISNFSDKTGSVNTRPVVWTGENWQTLIDLGTLRENNLGIGLATAISADGKIIGGYSEVDDRANSSAVIWTGDDWKTKIRLKSLPSYNDNYYNSTKVYALTKDGKIAGGTSTDASNNKTGDRPVIWSGENYEVITDLGTLDKGFGLSPNRMEGVVTSLNDDGTIIAGFSEDDNNDRGSWKPVVWKVKYTNTTPTTPPTTPPPVTPPTTPPVTPPTTPPVTPPITPPTTPPTTPPVTPPTTPVVVGMIDVANTVGTINTLGQDSFGVMAMQAHALDRLQYACHTHKGLCVGLQEDVSISDTKGDKRRDVAVGASVGYGFGNGLSVGVSLDHSINRKLPSSYRHQGDDVGIGAVVRYQANNGLFGEVSGAVDDYSVTINRPLLANTELGVNETTIKGVSYQAKVGKALTLGRSAVRTYTGVKHIDISREAYHENDNTAFPISYGEMKLKATYATVGANAQIGINDKLAWVNHAEIAQQISGDDPVYTASLTGVEKHEFAHTASPAKTVGHFASGVRYQANPSTHLEFTPYVKKHNDDKTGYGALFRLETKF